MPEKPRRRKQAAPPAPKMPPAPAGNTELSDEELGQVSGGIGLTNDIRLAEPKMPTTQSLVIPKLDNSILP